MNFPVNISVPYIDNLEQRGYADMIEKLVADQAKNNCPTAFHAARSKRSIEDFSYQGSKKTWYDVKSFDVNSDFSMPNLVSIDRLKKTLADDKQDIVYIVVHYALDHLQKTVTIKEIQFRPIYSIHPNVLAIQNLGKGVLQVKNMHNALETYDGSREEWMKIISSMAVEFYDKQVIKFQKLKKTWC